MKNIYVLCGGRSPEHEVSLVTAMTIINGLNKQLYRVVPVYISKEGCWQPLEPVTHELASVEELRAQTGSTGSAARSAADFLARLAADGDGGACVFPALHGEYGEDGTVQGMLELLNIPYVGNGVGASAASIDKTMTKKIAAAAGIPQSEYLYFHRQDWEQEEAQWCQRIETLIGYPCYVKPAKLGSSIGISCCASRNELVAAITEALRYDGKVLVEQEIKGREVQLAVLGNERPVCSVAGEFVREADFFSYEKKYESGTLIKRIPAILSAPVYEKLRAMALSLFRALDGSGLMRTDFFVTDRGDIYLNEVNTLPGFTKNSMFPVLWEKTAGTTYTQLLDRLIELAMERHAGKQMTAIQGVEA
ncbi:D-alanine--D-alanine ligase family protein [Paenibacillus tarimensis]|uniref:D-alanine--D-alanine ligase family protein n=1 Tax=Paenibacillus tarimensis TaxID=416012 RepID=UPI001F23835D|nr:D-alanine--D-alanine ligase family protein [Paenibacillus tarimensis]MCF2945300.1 D-alanine--D-alanine ligase [Paenibacillus tarimensis]